MSEKDNQLQKILDEILEDKNANLTPILCESRVKSQLCEKSDESV